MKNPIYKKEMYLLLAKAIDIICTKIKYIFELKLYQQSNVKSLNIKEP